MQTLENAIAAALAFLIPLFIGGAPRHVRKSQQ
jgi:hypothetical protein